MVVAASLAASASARTGNRSLTQTYPVATALCAKARAGTLPVKLAPKSAAVITSCDTLENAFPSLVSTVDASESSLLSTLSAQKALVATACPKPVTNAAACTTARQTASSADSAARATEQAAVKAYHAAIETNRLTFWSAISALR
jgi:hypothetical protein